MIKIICLDLDGTLLNSAKEIDSSTITCIKKLKEKEIMVVLTSGRHYNDMKKYINCLKQKNDKYVICSDGQYIMSTSGTVLWTNDYLVTYDIKKILSILDINRCFAVLEKQNKIICKGPISFLVEKAKGLIRGSERVCRVSQISEGLKIEKLMFFNQTLSEGKRHLLADDYTVHNLQDNRDGFEVLHKNVSKSRAINKLCEMEDISQDEVLFIGDDYNDAECIMSLKNTVAMGNASLDIKRLAKHITDTNDMNGVYGVLNKILEMG